MRLNIKTIVTNLVSWGQRNPLTLLIILGYLSLRLVNFNSHITFLGDQGRDAIIIKRILTLEHWPAIGAPMSIGQIYLGPFYYYFMAPWLLISLFHPAGLAWGVLIVGFIFSLLAFWQIRRQYDPITANIFLLLLAFSAANISLSRFSWNPNLLPFFTFFTIVVFDRLLTNRQTLVAILFGALFSFSFQLHYLSVFLLPTLFLFWLNEIRLRPHQLFAYLRLAIWSAISFMFFSLPLLIYDLRHQFLNSRNLIKFLGSGEGGGGFSWYRLGETAIHFWQNFLQVRLNSGPALLLLGAIVVIALVIKSKSKNRLFYLNLTSLLVFLLGFSFLSSGRYEHYYASIYLSMMLVLAVIFGIRSRVCPICRIVIVILLVVYIVTNSGRFRIYFSPGGNQIQDAQKVANFLSPQIGPKPFNFATWPVAFSEDNYLYFLELAGQKVADRRRVEITQQLFVVCETRDCPVINSPSWNISMFGQAKIAKMWRFDNLFIYKLIHQNDH